MSQDSIFWDIGANIGIYSIYAAKLKNCQVFAFEPSVFNLDQLARNISLNKVEKNIAICPIALNNKIGINTFKLSSLTMGGALSSFAHNVDANGDYLGAMLEYRTLGVTLDCLNQFFDIPKPNYIKIDVDGIEHLILSGGVNILREVNSVLVELPGVWQEQSRDAKRYLQDAGLRLVSSHSYDPDLNPNASANEIWAR
jgi:FkbM family methyltransferase